MSNSDILINIVRFILLVFLQVLVLNNINLGGYINPYLYILFIVLYPLDGDKGLLIFLGFLLGLSIDIFEDSGGVHAAACAFIAYIRPVVLKYSFGVSYEYNSVKIRKADPMERLTYIASLVFMHHFVMFSLEIFSFKHTLLLLKSTLFSGLFTIIVIVCTMIIFNKKSQ
ncbi:rod shape-determining protein MreD [Aequorivita sp. F47161]|uniref:Rod shape-determining protein MreD n=1 Tax=Aequorivita vitellina TaxID=2874475 RepID=A0A9X1QX75_9FLAO|nr:rod shape-determining protein MreD [Aequorivita vitellina]MCG2418244.1 rod shape-determining protein MreD [Aequorivita vitellina]MCZ4318130.1 rod shape-determining protein MreD [Aequorivita viscosa]